MKYSIKLAVLGALLAAGVAQAATTTYTTNLVRTVSFALTATIQGPTTTKGTTVTTASVATKDVIGALAKALGTNFTSKAQLLSVEYSGGDSKWVVRDVVNKKNVDTVVDQYFMGETLMEVKKSTVSGGKETGTEYAIELVGLQTPSLSATLYGYDTATIATRAWSATGVGYGMVGANHAVFKGTATGSAQKAEKVPTSGP